MEKVFQVLNQMARDGEVQNSPSRPERKLENTRRANCIKRATKQIKVAIKTR